ncbi:MAG: hypothetical protein MZU91_08850 [Desulfosudis oleivorans]|nr:hypothetical protein [Desulfosudis oleivorans]
MEADRDKAVAGAARADRLQEELPALACVRNVGHRKPHERGVPCTAGKMSTVRDSND